MFQTITVEGHAPEVPFGVAEHKIKPRREAEAEESTIRSNV